MLGQQLRLYGTLVLQDAEGCRQQPGCVYGL